jgi:CheY-like chemotaxis protein
MRSILLIAESDLELRDACRRFFAERGYDVETAADGLDCVEKLRRVSPAVLVLDRELRWGGADGVLALLREQGAQCEVSVVLTATTDGSANVAVALQAARRAIPPQALRADRAARKCARTYGANRTRESVRLESRVCLPGAFHRLTQNNDPPLS